MRPQLYYQLFGIKPLIVAGVDEAGRGPLAGPVVSSAVVLDPAYPIPELNDSKKLSQKKREALYYEIRKSALFCSIGRADVEEIDQLNILQATLLSMERALSDLACIPELIAVDGNQAPNSPYPVKTIPGGDALIMEISAASIIAKVTRDWEMIELDRKYPGYGLAKHKGYPTKEHVNAIKSLGVQPFHRKSFKPVSQYL